LALLFHPIVQLVLVILLDVLKNRQKQMRFRRSFATEEKYPDVAWERWCRMTPDQAQEILQGLIEYEFPFAFGASVSFALLKVYGIPSISRLLVRTGEFSDIKKVSKRTADTGVLLLEFCLNKPSSQRHIEAVARMNSLHEPYIRQKEVSQTDMLYTLSLFVLEPIRFIEKREWRDLSHVEVAAIGTFWKAVAEEMNIDYATILPKSESYYCDGFEFVQRLEVWSAFYEIRRMQPAESNRKLVDAQIEGLLYNLPNSFKTFGLWMISSLAEDHVLRAIGLYRPPTIFRILLKMFWTLRRWVMRYLMLPRSTPRKYIEENSGSKDKHQLTDYLIHPWYVNPTFSNRWGLRAYTNRVFERKNPGDDGSTFLPEGYRIDEVGPAVGAGMGKDWMEKERARLQDLDLGKCPFGPVPERRYRGMMMATGEVEMMPISEGV